MSSALSNQLFVRDRAGYDEVFPSGQKDLDTSSEERNPSTTSPSSRDEGLEMDRPKGDSSDGLDDVELPIQSIIDPDGLREFIMLPLGTVNDFRSLIKESHFKTLRAKYQIPDNIPLYLPYKSQKCYYKGVEGVGAYEQMLKAGFRFPPKFTPPSPPPIPRFGRHPDFSKCLEGLSWRGGLVRGYVQRSQEVDGGGILSLLPSR